MNFKSNLVLGVLLIFAVNLFSKNIYVKFDPACMDRYEYRLNGNMAGNGLISYVLKKNDSERIMMEIGVESIKKVKRMPRGTKTCRKIKVNDLFVNAINSGKDKVYIVRSVGKYYTVSSVHLATYMSDSSNGFEMVGNQFDLSYSNQETNLMEHDLGGKDFSTKVFFFGTEEQNCKTSYLIKKIPNETCKPYTDMGVIPGIGIIEEKTGTTQAEAEQNVLRLVKINNIPLAEYLDGQCNGNTSDIAVEYNPEPEMVEVFQPATTTKPTAPSPVNYEVVFQAKIEPIEPEYTPATDEIVYSYNKPQAPIETFQPKGVQCKKLSYSGVHIVQSGQTLFGISRKYNVTVNQLRTWNKLGKKDLIKPCGSLYVLPPESVAANTNASHGALPTPANAVKSNNSNVNEFTAKGSGSAEVLFEKSANTLPSNVNTKRVASKGGCAKLSYDGVHIIQKGETLFSIARQNNVTVEQLEKWNKLSKNKSIKPCASLYIKTPESVIAAQNAKANPSSTSTAYRIPDSEMNTGYTNAVPNNTNISKGAANVAASDDMWNSGIEYHVVQKGETLASLAKMYGFTISRFRDINGLGNSNIIKIGQVLKTGNCLCPANGVGTINTNAGGTNGTGSNGAISTVKGNTGLNTTENNLTTKGKTSNSTKERVLEYRPVPAPYDYEVESAIINTTRTNGAISTRNGRKVHTVQENETMFFIANKYNISLELLRKLNNMEKSEVVIPHQKIYLE